MSLSISGRTWDEASSPAALGVARRYEAAWHEANGSSRRPDLLGFLVEAGSHPGAGLALLRCDMVLRWESGDRVGADWYLAHCPGLERDAVVALIYEEFCLREERDESPDREDYLARYPAVQSQLRRVLDIHGLVGSTETSVFHGNTTSSVPFPQAGETIAGFRLVKELGRGAFARVFLAEERQLADRPVALKVARAGSREPQLLARLQHTHIVPVHSYRTDPATGLHLLCMPYFGRVTLARLLEKTNIDTARGGADLLAALDRVDPEEPPPPHSPGRAALAKRTYIQAVAWWGSRMAEALEHAHVRGVLHRDVKPSNVLITGDGLPMLLDFNLARVAITDGDDSDGMMPGGTVDYMSPEHLEELAEGLSDRVGPRSDVYGLGVLLYEAVMGARPFPPPRGSSSVTELLLRAAADRRCGAPRIRHARPEVPAALEAVIARCLAPELDDRYASAGELAIDLQAVANDGPLQFAREPVPQRAYRWARRNRRKLLAAVPVMATVAVFSGLLAHERNIATRRLNEYQARHAQVQKLFDKGNESVDNGEFRTAMAQFTLAEQVADYPGVGKWTRLLAGSPESGETWLSLEELKRKSHSKYVVAKLTGEIREQAAAFFRAAVPLRFVLTGFGSDLEAASADVEKALAPFYVLKHKDWVADPDLTLLEPGQRQRLVNEVNEILFLWAILLEHSREPDALRLASQVCELALRFAEPSGPWRALRARLEGGTAQIPAAGSEVSALACFQWGLLARETRPDAAIVWFRKAVDGARKNSWYHYYLAYAYDQYANDATGALRHYEVALAFEDKNPWVRFSRARHYRRGLLGLAEKEFERALSDFRELPESARHPGFRQKARLELGLVHHSLGKFAESRADYEWVIATAPASPEAYAARLNLAKLDADSGNLTRALAAYETLLTSNPADGSARLGRGLLLLRQDRASEADDDLSCLLESGAADRREVLSQRAVARLRLGLKTEALADVNEALALAPTPYLERLQTRVLLALGRIRDVAFTRPEEIEALPLAGPTLRDDVLRVAAQLRTEARTAGTRPSRLQAHLTRAILLSTVRGYEAEALSEASQAIDLAPMAANPYLIRARILMRVGFVSLAGVDVEHAATLEPKDPSVWELRAMLKTASGDPSRGLADLDRAVAFGGAGMSVRGPRAEALMALGKPQKALAEWYAAIRADPEDPAGYLGRARAFLALRQYDQAFADLEQASNWIEGHPAFGLRVLLTYACCTAGRPAQLPRLAALTKRVLADLAPVQVVKTSAVRTVKRPLP